MLKESIQRIREYGVAGMKWGERATKSKDPAVVARRMKTLLARMKRVDHYGVYSASKPRMFDVRYVSRRLNKEYGTLATKTTKMRRPGQL
jgi:hypothetical protein